METNQEVLDAINAWTDIIADPNQLLVNLNQGYSFVITRDQYNTWSGITGVSCIHAYPAIFSGIMKFVVVDDVTDANEDIDFDNVFTNTYTYGKTDTTLGNIYGPPNNISIQDALERVFRWLMNKNGWVHHAMTVRNGMFQAFTIPFEDLVDLFASTEGDELYVLIGMKTDGAADLILWSDTMSFLDPKSVADVSCAIPPFGSEGEGAFQLLVQSGQ
ncbi:MAG: hypothetical protein A3D31_18825 [Candidatus Fluviicola riflensis]|nr:MAG: hypothetical protein CHH17_03335 [Candidatus Fluviicola riflensis]OGS76500.1 MAG: hypothetical protein A3D31_18825 [Candidatus Fluviicola riflensis]OGS82794.1 MAG: hypothetical protein A2724_13650 [Fluviicola sp. RIFCSPHIGHO2_01_FULL_43_53]OGS89093.1 MAG: hypothetical protein A3E30_17310 [Fluviicola sp. RIFCSPHIGHO2_12_FULL_43_24]